MRLEFKGEKHAVIVAVAVVAVVAVVVVVVVAVAAVVVVVEVAIAVVEKRGSVAVWIRLIEDRSRGPLDR